MTRKFIRGLSHTLAIMIGFFLALTLFVDSKCILFLIATLIAAIVSVVLVNKEVAEQEKRFGKKFSEDEHNEWFGE